METKREKEIMLRNRLVRNQQYEERRQKDYEDAINREAEMARLLRENYLKQAETMQCQLEDINERHNQQVHQRHSQFCGFVVNQLVELSLKLAEGKVVHNGHIPPRLLNEWMLLYRQGKRLDTNHTIPLTKDKVTTAVQPIDASPAEERDDAVAELKPPSTSQQQQDDYDADAINALDESEFASYVSATGDWQFRPETGPSAQAPQKNEMLAEVVASLLALATVKDGVKEKQLDNPLNIVIIGKPYSGKGTVAAQLAEKYNLKTVNVAALVKEAIE